MSHQSSPLSSSSHPRIQIYTHPSPLTTLIPHLIPHLPRTLPLLRRLQFHFHSTHALVLSTLPPIPPDVPPSPTPPSTPFLAAYLDRSRSPETECWLFSSLELSPSSQDEDQNESLKSLVRSQLLALFSHIAALPLPPAYEGRDPDSGGRYLVVGSVHESVLALLKDVDVKNLRDSATGLVMQPTLRAEGEEEGKANGEGLGEMNPQKGAQLPLDSAQVVHRHTVPYVKFLFAPSSLPAASASNVSGQGQSGDSQLPEGLVWTIPRYDEFALVRSRTDIPRRDRTLALLPSMGIRERKKENMGGGGGEMRDEEGRLVAWAFLSPDGSLASLHVEEEFRGRGLGKMVARRAMGMIRSGKGEGMVGDSGDRQAQWGFVGVSHEEAWGHADVAEDNRGSIGVARGLGGEEGWRCFWVWIDLEEVDMVVKNREGNDRAGGARDMNACS